MPEPALDLVAPAGVRGRVVHVEPGVPFEPVCDRRGLVGAVVVTDQVHVEVFGDPGVDLAQELLELDRAVPAVQA